MASMRRYPAFDEVNDDNASNVAVGIGVTQVVDGIRGVSATRASSLVSVRGRSDRFLLPPSMVAIALRPAVRTTDLHKLRLIP